MSINRNVNHAGLLLISLNSQSDVRARLAEWINHSMNYHIWLYLIIVLLLKSWKHKFKNYVYWFNFVFNHNQRSMKVKPPSVWQLLSTCCLNLACFLNIIVYSRNRNMVWLRDFHSHSINKVSSPTKGPPLFYFKPLKELLTWLVGWPCST